MSKKRTNTQSTQASNSGSPMPGEPEYLAVGKLHRPHGVRGEMRMSVWTDFPERLQPDTLVYLGKRHMPVHIKSLRGHQQDVLIAFEEFRDREEVSQFRNQVVFVRTADLPALPDDGLYLHQLLGLQVVRDEDDVLLGVVAEILETGANDVLLVRREGKSDILIPDIDPVIIEIDLEKGEIRVNLLPGLIPEDDLG
jgi:16S rRNA processing protein RimM